VGSVAITRQCLFISFVCRVTDIFFFNRLYTQYPTLTAFPLGCQSIGQRSRCHGCYCFYVTWNVSRLCTQSASWHVLYIPIQTEKPILCWTIFYSVQLFEKRNRLPHSIWVVVCIYFKRSSMCLALLCIRDKTRFYLKLIFNFLLNQIATCYSVLHEQSMGS
jgi:hypothetical protein